MPSTSQSGIGQRHSKSDGQVALRWMLQRGVVVIPKSVRKERMAENIDVFDFELTDEQMNQFATLDLGQTVVLDHRDPEPVVRLNSLRRAS